MSEWSGKMLMLKTYDLKAIESKTIEYSIKYYLIFIFTAYVLKTISCTIQLNSINHSFLSE